MSGLAARASIVDPNAKVHSIATLMLLLDWIPCVFTTVIALPQFCSFRGCTIGYNCLQA